MSLLTVVAGTNMLDDENSEKIKVDYVKYHEEYIDGRNDIGLIHLSKPLTFNDRIKKIELQNTPLKGENLTANLTGWGKTEVIFYNSCFSIINSLRKKTS